MRTIWRYEVLLQARVTLRLPRGAQVIEWAESDRLAGGVSLWVIVDTDEPVVDREILVVGTGHPIPDDAGEHLATVPLQGGCFVFHLFDVAPLQCVLASPRGDS